MLTGSAPVDDTHSGTGRIPSIRMRPLTLRECLGSTTSVNVKALLSEEVLALTETGGCTLEDYRLTS